MINSLVSVVLCTYNGEKYVSEQLASICRQTHSQLEIIIIDDASTDNTYSILEAARNKDPRIRLYRNESNVGLTKNFQKGCEYVNGEYVAIADQDDIWKEDKIEVLLSRITSSDEIIMVHGMSTRFENFGKFHSKSLRYVKYEAARDVRNFFLSNFINGHNMLFRRDLLEVALPFPETVIYDWWLAAVAVCNGRIESVPQILVWHRVHETNATGKGKKKMLLHKQVATILPELMNIKAIQPHQRRFAVQMLQHFNRLNSRQFSLPLFLFLVKNSRLLFSYKKRKIPWFSYTKHSLRASMGHKMV